MIAWRTFACSVAALGLLTFTNCGDDEMATSGLSAGSAGSQGSSSGESSSGGSSSGGGTTAASTDPTSGSVSETATTGSPTTGPSTTTAPNTTGDQTTGGGSSGGGGADCGNGKIDPNEQCDGANLNGFTCESLGNAGGTLACDPVTCTFDTSMCDGGGGGTSG